MIKKREGELSKNSYRNQVVERLKGISKTILDMSVPIAIDVSLEKVCKIIQKKLHTFYKDTIINSLITLGLNITGILLVHFVPFGEIVSNIVAIIFFLTATFFGIYKLIKFLLNYGKTSIKLIKNIFNRKSLSRGIEYFLLDEFPAISFFYAGIKIGSEYCISLKQVPNFNEIVQYFIKTFWKQLTIFVICFSAYYFLILFLIVLGGTYGYL